MVSFKTQDISLHEDVDNLICEIDKKLSKIAKNKYDSNIYGYDYFVNLDDYNLLYRYRFILLKKYNKSCCFKGYLIDDIISKIKQLLNSK